MPARISRGLLAFALLACAAPAAVAQVSPDVYDPDRDDRFVNDRFADDFVFFEREPPGVRFGLAVGSWTYFGPDFALFDDGLTDELGVIEDETFTSLGVNAFVSAPLAPELLYGRALVGVVGIGQDRDLSFNPFAASPLLQVEGNLLLNLASYTSSSLVPYLFSGVGAYFAGPFYDDAGFFDDIGVGIAETAVYVPVGVGVDYAFSPNVSLFAEAAFQFGLTEIIDEDEFIDFALAEGYFPGCSSGHPDHPDCKPIGDDFVGDGFDFQNRFNALQSRVGVQFGFGGGREAFIPPPPPPPVVRPLPPVRPVEPVRPFEPEPEPVPAFCPVVELNSVYFEYGTVSLDRRAQRLLDENIELLLSEEACCVYIDGYTDQAEDDQFGSRVSGRRAQAVYDYYLSRGVSASRLQIRNRGISLPPCDKEDPGIGCSRSRRVESLPIDCERFEEALGRRFDDDRRFDERFDDDRRLDDRDRARRDYDGGRR